MGEARHDGRPVELLELVQLRAVHQPGDHLAHVVLRGERGRHDPVDLGGVVTRLAWRDQRHVRPVRGAEVPGDPPGDGERMAVIRRIMVGDAALARMHVRAAQLLGGHDLAGRRLHQRRSAEEDRALVAHDDRLVRHRRHIGPARRARAHHRRDLRDAGRRHVGLVEEDAPEMLAVGEDVGLIGQVRPARIDQIETRQVVLAGDLLRPQVLLHRDGIIGAALDRRVVADDDAGPPLDPPDPGDDRGGMDVALVHAVGGERRQLQERRAGIEQPPHALARKQLAAIGVALARALVPALRRRRQPHAQFAGQQRHRRGVVLEARVAGGDRGGQTRHAGPYVRGRRSRRGAFPVLSCPTTARAASPRRTGRRTGPPGDAWTAFCTTFRGFSR